MHLSSVFIVFTCVLSKSASTIMPSAQKLVRSKQAIAIKATADGTIIHHYSNLRVGRLISRYKRFLADIVFEEIKECKLSKELPTSTDILTTNGLEAVKATVVHCPNTGSMYNLIPPANLNPACACSLAPDGTKRKYNHTLEMIVENNTWVGVHSALANKMVENALNAK